MNEKVEFVAGAGPLKPWQAYLFAMLATAATFALRFALEGQLGGHPTLVIFLLPIMVTAYLGGWQAALLGTGISCLGADYFLLLPRQTLAVTSVAERWQLFFVALAGVVISVIIEALHRARRRAELATREHQQAEAALRAGNEWLQTVTENLSEGLVTSELDGRLIHWNRAGFEMHGFATREEGLRSLPDFHEIFALSSLDGAVLPFNQWPLQRILGGEQLRGIEVRIRRVQSEWQRVFSYSGAIVRDAEGNSVAFMSIGDITHRSQAQEKEVWLASFPERNSSPVLEVDIATGIIHYANPAVSRSMPDFENLGQRHPALAGLAEVQKTLRNGEADSVRREVATGGVVWAQAITYIPETRRLRIYCLNITELKQAEAALRESQQALRLTLDAAHIGHWDLNLLTLASHRSVQHDQVFGYAKLQPDWTYEKFLSHVHPEDRERVDGLYQAGVAARSAWDFECRIIRADGALRWIWGHGNLFTSPAGEGIRMLGMVSDITARKLVKEEIRQLNAGLEQRVTERTAQLEAANRELAAYSSGVLRDLRVAEAADQLKSAFLATMSHELRTPLNSIIGFTGIVLMGKAGALNAEQAKQLGWVRQSAWHLLALINDVLDLSKIEAGHLEMRAEPFDLPASITRVLNISGPQAEKKGLAFGAVVRPELGEMVSDQRRVEQILLNLLSNAVKFTDHGHVRLTAELLADFQSSPLAAPCRAVRFRVADTGIGLKREDLPLLFEPFRQIDTGLARQAEGTGLGLAISRRLATLLGGEISAASEFSQGSQFTVTLPLQIPSNPCPQPSS